jgi:hypothetical protein
MNLRPSWKVCLAALVGFACGSVVFHTPTVKAQYGSVTIQQVPLLSLRSTLNVSGTVVGFSCAQTESEVECYVASR